jgi:hypothetical protein
MRRILAAAQGNICFGVWKPTGSHNLILHHVGWTFDATITTEQQPEPLPWTRRIRCLPTVKAIPEHLPSKPLILMEFKVRSY